MKKTAANEKYNKYLIDADHLLYEILWMSSKTKKSIVSSVEEAIMALNKVTDGIEDRCFFHFQALPRPSGGKKEVLQIVDYKGNRPAKTPQLHEIYNELVVNKLPLHFPVVVTIEEVDDAISNAGYMRYSECLMISQDGDFSQIPGDLMRIPRWSLLNGSLCIEKGNSHSVAYPVDCISPSEGQRHILAKMLTGDPSDNIVGIPGFGPTRTKALINEELIHRDPNERIIQRVLEAYRAYFEKHGADDPSYALDYFIEVLYAIILRTMHRNHREASDFFLKTLLHEDEYEKIKEQVVLSTHLITP